MAEEEYETFAQVKTRLDEIVRAVGDDDLPLDDALSLYEEAVRLGMRASDLLEAGIEPAEAAAAQAEADADAQGTEPAAKGPTG